MEREKLFGSNVIDLPLRKTTIHYTKQTNILGRERDIWYNYNEIE